MSLCEDNCELVDYDNDKKRVKCSCKTKALFSLDNIELDNKEFIKNFLDIKKITNIEIVKCYKIVINKNNIKNNYGFFIISFIFILYFICIIIFYWKSLKNLIKEIIEIINEMKNKQNQNNKNNQIYSSDNSIHKKRIRKKNIKISKVEIHSSVKKVKPEKYLILKNNKRIKNKMNYNIYKKMKEKNKNTDSELNSLSYEEALKIDKRTYCQYYFSLLKKKQSKLIFNIIFILSK